MTRVVEFQEHKCNQVSTRSPVDALKEALQASITTIQTNPLLEYQNTSRYQLVAIVLAAMSKLMVGNARAMTTS
jgi:hypothetical protein